MKRTFLAVALPCLIAVGAVSLNCSDEGGYKPPGGKGGAGGTPTTTTTGGGNGGDPTTTTGGGNGGDPATTTGGGMAGSMGVGGQGVGGQGVGGQGVGGQGVGGQGVGGGGAAGQGVGGRGGGGAGGAAGGGGGGAGGAGGMPGAICTAGDCTAVLKTRAGQPMDGWPNIDPPRQSQPPDGIQGNSQVDNAAPAAGDQMCGSPCAGTEGRADHGLPLKWASWQLMGPGINAGTTYRVTIHFWGVVECKTYQSLQNCPRPANAGRAAKYDMWCPGGTDPAGSADHYNTYMISVTPQRSGTTPNLGPMQGPMPAAPGKADGTGNWWMLNECPTGESESHKTWMIDYEKTINVPGGSWINFLDFDTNCREILNCGTSNDAAGVCTMQYNLPVTGAVPAPPTSISTQPASAGAGSYGQWIFFDVKNIVPM